MNIFLRENFCLKTKLVLTHFGTIVFARPVYKVRPPLLYHVHFNLNPEGHITVGYMTSRSEHEDFFTTKKQDKAFAFFYAKVILLEHGVINEKCADPFSVEVGDRLFTIARSSCY